MLFVVLCVLLVLFVMAPRLFLEVAAFLVPITIVLALIMTGP